VNIVYQSKLISPTNSWVNLKAFNGGYEVTRSGDTNAPRDVFRYTFEIMAFIPMMSDFAQNYTRVSLILRCNFDFQNAYVLHGDSVDLGIYKGKKDAIPLTRSMDDIYIWSYDLCRPSFELADYSGYLRKYNMLSLQRLDSTSDTLSIVIHYPKEI